MAGAEKRKSKRFMRRISARFGENTPDRSGFTRDVSAHGAFIIASNMPAIGTRIKVQFVLNASRSFFFEAVVRRHRVTPAKLRHVEQSGFGVSFLSPAEVIGEFLPISSPPKRLEITFESAEQLAAYWESELRFGGMFIPSELSYEQDERIDLVFTFSFAGVSFEVPAKVARRLTAPVMGLGLVFVDVDQAKRSIEPFTSSKT
jgi:hypothetical protein